MNTSYDIAVIGGGAAGFFATIKAAEKGKRVVLLEKSNKLLTKVLVSGGGRCNVTHDCNFPSQLVKFYPRGGKSLKKAFGIFGPLNTRQWFEKRGVALKAEPDGRMFPVTDDSRTIADCLLNETRKLGIQIRTRSEVESIEPLSSGGFTIKIKSAETIRCAKVIITTGGFNKISGYHFIKKLGVEIVSPVPSLFTFNVPDSDLKELMGLSVPDATVQIPGSSWKENGPVLITHWGFSAPAVIKLSSRAAIDLHERHYHFPILINWTGLGEEVARERLAQLRHQHPKKTVAGNTQFDIPARLWEKLCEKAGVESVIRFGELPAKTLNRLIEMLIRCPFDVKGKTTFKEEFVTCGGVDLKEIDLTTFESKQLPGLYFAGEVLNVDGLTGGFNFQHAWTSGFLAGSAAGE